MNKKDLIQKLSQFTLSKTQSKHIVNFIFQEIFKSLVASQRVNITNFGSFTPKFYKAKKMYDPKKKKYVLINPRLRIKFELSKKLLKSLNTQYSNK